MMRHMNVDPPNCTAPKALNGWIRTAARLRVGVLRREVPQQAQHLRAPARQGRTVEAKSTVALDWSDRPNVLFGAARLG